MRHSRRCASRTGGRCTCKPSPSYQAFVYDRRSGQKIRKTFSGKGALSAAKSWRNDALAAANHGMLALPTRQTLREAAEAWLAGATAEPPTILTPAAATATSRPCCAATRATCGTTCSAALGDRRLSEVRRGDLQALVDKLDRL